MSRTRPLPPDPTDLTRIIRDRLASRFRQDVEPLHAPRISPEAAPDFLGRLADGTVVVVEAKSGQAGVRAVTQLVGQGHLLQRQLGRSKSTAATSRNRRARGADSGRPQRSRTDLPDMDLILMAPAFSLESRRAASITGVTLLETALLAIRHSEVRFSSRPRTRVPLTSATSWKVVLPLIQKRRFKTIRALSEHSGVSYGWTHTVVSHLLSLEIVSKSQRRIRVDAPSRLFDFIATERPMRALLALELPVSPTIPIPALFGSLRRVIPGMSEPVLCGLSAAEFHGSTLRFPRTAQAYVAPNAEVRNAIAHSSLLRNVLRVRSTGGASRRKTAQEADRDSVALSLYFPDRDVTTARIRSRGLYATSFAQTILDCAGLGSSGQRAIQELVSIRGNES